jgi:SpoVK/Ycf46/Vps4 family AAA+-type ATPase
MNDNTETNVFDIRTAFPSDDAKVRLERLVGLDTVKERIARSLAILVNPEGLRAWAKKHHKADIKLLEFVERRPPLVILAGDVGTGKTELASTIADPIARQEEIEITFLPLSLSTRGSGKVGEMTKLLSTAFDETYQMASRLKNQGGKAHGAVILLVDEADAIVQSREDSQMHHEDRAGVNAFIRGINRLTEQGLPVAVILCTNRLSAIDPAVRRRAAEVFELTRPNDEQRTHVLHDPLSEIGFTEDEIARLVEVTGQTGAREVGFTYSDLTQRLLPALVLAAYPDQAISFDHALKIASEIHPTPRFMEEENI